MMNRQIFMVGGKKRRKGGEWERSEKDTLPFFAWRVNTPTRVSYRFQSMDNQQMCNFIIE
ncbi:hypothetical protein [Aneurinibacillus migulanus]|uniref:hypothetical protein n=1 Tax=Aneurinibacillus migulanus TaxID=47500 RepID=UPI001F2BA582|nr:hypothetical protein [Aneurinibacillus migulanus]